MNDRDRTYLLKELTRTIDESDSTAAFCLCQRWILKNALALLKEQESTTFNPHYIDEYGKHFICGVECGSCHEKISRTYKFCPYCGKEIKWEWE